jgi:hypothetical protein
VKVVHSQFPYLSNTLPPVCEVMNVSFTQIPDIMSPTGFDKLVYDVGLRIEHALVRLFQSSNPHLPFGHPQMWNISL